MHIFIIIQLLVTLLLSNHVLADRSPKPPSNNAILLSRVHSLTLHGGRLTSSRRVSPIPQLKCTGPSKRICNMYTIDTMRCTNEGYGYDEEDIQWTCTAELPQEFKLGSTDVVCEGYRNADDNWVLKGSCGVEYRLLLTELGEEKFGRDTSGSSGELGPVATFIFWGIMVLVCGAIVMGMLDICFGRQQGEGANAGGYGGGGGDGGGGPPRPPPPYSSSPPPYYSSSDPRTSGSGWRPGFWTGALGGAAAGYEMGRRSNRNRSGSSWTSSRYQSSRRYDDSGEGSSGLSSTTTSTGFGSTRRR
ncbi:DUF1183 domain protein [Aspergillus ibericus CBS 121593]|uniref:Store-operated calcium entry-associated regulatory factor n=1 Tax=Aspergillus ibericus CBS 121593 TaxID=1448316 RepID=A0A395H4E3_9EURO|nr:hypothetical protein BO80DRAFT_423657 [Aspergillus ibericus CBS 121593]RAL02752.1 hypothetical protein BO80DRAFT_423657 [Aspergillus ibericus CBS 121593]